MRKRLMFTMVLFMLLVLAACGTGGSNDNDDQTETAENETEDSEARDDRSATNEKAKEEAIISDLGIYIGQADPHTIEIETRVGPERFQLTEETASQIEQFQQNDEVKFTYKVNENEQNVLESIQKMNSSDENEEESITETGIYIGQADPHTIEIETEEGPTAFQLTMEARDDIEQLTAGHEVTYTYHDNGVQLVIETIEHSE